MKNYLIRCGEIHQHVQTNGYLDAVKFAAKLFPGGKGIHIKEVGIEWNKKALEFKNANTYLHNNLEVGQEVCINYNPHIYNGINQKYSLHEFTLEGMSVPLLLSRDELALFINPQDVKK